ncbi:unnamed protein product [Heligmosomoides polygyrus]|uniref:Endo/exonuclease/phosphatase domain-containing protein n=1 Tax=Heligmosomoides polygyrus TaxID=6339 RepID=A0A3P8CP28_HELPZ|nr:unnamed protein product [Heligmosomoides polygyrus]
MKERWKKMYDKLRKEHENKTKASIIHMIHRDDVVYNCLLPEKNEAKRVSIRKLFLRWSATTYRDDPKPDVVFRRRNMASDIVVPLVEIPSTSSRRDEYDRLERGENTISQEEETLDKETLEWLQTMSDAVFDMAAENQDYLEQLLALRSPCDRPAYGDPMSCYMVDDVKARVSPGLQCAAALRGTIVGIDIDQTARRIDMRRSWCGQDPRATLNVGTLTGRSCELAETSERRRVDFCAVQETRWFCRKSRDIGRRFKAVLCGSPRTPSGVSERFRDSIVSVERFDDRLMKIVVAGKERLYHFFSAYAPQTRCSDQAKEVFWSLLDEKRAEILSKDAIIVDGDLNGHVGAMKDGYSCLLDSAVRSITRMVSVCLNMRSRITHNLTIVNTAFRKRDSHLISYYSGDFKTQIGFLLMKDRDRSLVTDRRSCRI